MAVTYPLIRLRRPLALGRWNAGRNSLEDLEQILEEVSRQKPEQPYYKCGLSAREVLNELKVLLITEILTKILMRSSE